MKVNVRQEERYKMSFNKFDIRTNLKNVQRDILEAEGVLEEGSYPRLILYKARMEIRNATSLLEKNPEFCPE